MKKIGLLALMVVMGIVTFGWAEEVSQQEENVTYAIPNGWKLIDVSKEKAAKTFATSEDPKQRAVVIVRVLNVPEQTAFQWAIDEVKGLESHGAQMTVQPREVNLGNLSWVVLEWDATMKDAKGNPIPTKGRQYYVKPTEGPLMIEISIMGRENVLIDTNQEEINNFLSSFKFLKEAKAESDAATAEELTKIGVQKFYAQQFEEAIELYEQALTKTTNTDLQANIFFNLSSAYLEKGILPYINTKDDSFYKKSIEYAEKCLNITPGHWKALANIATVYMNINDLEKADFYYKEAEKYVDINSPEYQQLILQHGVVKGVLKAREEQNKN